MSGGRHSVTIPCNPTMFKAALVSVGKTVEDAGAALGVSRQAVNLWIVGERIPPRRLADLAEKFGWSPEQVQRICDWHDSPKDIVRENQRLRAENEKLKAAVAALIGEEA